MEADFYSGLSGSTGTATMRLRQAYATISWKDLPLSDEKKASVGLKIGQAQVSLKHGNFIVNLGGATAADVRELISEVQEQVYAYTGIRLEPEVKFVGEF